MLEKAKLLEALKLAREFSKKRNFTQTVDIVVNLTGINPKKQEESIDIFVALPVFRKKQVKICALIDNNLTEKAKIFDKIILKEELQKLSKKEIKTIAKQYNFFIAQVNIMPLVATTFGKILGPLGKMPSPKIGCVITPETNLADLKNRLQNIVRIRTKNEPIIKTFIGIEEMKDEELADNLIAIYSALINSLPQEEGNVKNTGIKLTMGPLIKIGSKKEEIQDSINKSKLKINKPRENKKETKETKKEIIKKPKKENKK